MIKLKDLITEVSGATRMSEKEWTMIHSKLKPNKNDKIDIRYDINPIKPKYVNIINIFFFIIA